MITLAAGDFILNLWNCFDEYRGENVQLGTQFQFLALDLLRP